MAPGIVIEIEKGNRKEGAHLVLAKSSDVSHQFFRFKKSDDYYIIETFQNTGNVIDVLYSKMVNENKIQMHSFNGTNAQKFKLIDAGEGYISILSSIDHNFCLDVTHSGTKPGTKIWLYSRNNTSAQQFKLIGKNYLSQSIKYAEKFCLNRNPEYESKEDNSTNFCSQCLIAGGVDPDPIWKKGEDAFNKGIAKTLYNGIDYEYWDLKKLDVDEVKAKYSVKSEKVLLFVGRMEEQKNPIYALQITNEIHKRIPDILLFMVGDGSLLESARKYANDNRMNEYIKFLPANSDIRELQSISDIMIAPSLWEGLSIAYIEAQKMKTMVFSSDQVPYEVDMGYCKHYPLGEPNTWINGICDYLSEKSRDITLENPQRFDIKETSNKLL